MKLLFSPVRVGDVFICIFALITSMVVLVEPCSRLACVEEQTRAEQSVVFTSEKEGVLSMDEDSTDREPLFDFQSFPVPSHYRYPWTFGTPHPAC